MGYNDDRAEVLREEVLQPGYRLNVEVVGRLVHEDYVGISEQALRKQNLDLLVTGQGIHLLVENLLRQTQTLYQLGSVGLSLPAVQLCELGLQLGSAGAVLLGEILLGVERVLLLHDVVQALVAEDNGVLHGVVVERVVILAQHRHAELRGL